MTNETTFVNISDSESTGSNIGDNDMTAPYKKAHVSNSSNPITRKPHKQTSNKKPPPLLSINPNKSVARVVAPPKPTDTASTVSVSSPIASQHAALLINSNTAGGGGRHYYRYHPYMAQAVHQPPKITVDLLSQMEARSSSMMPAVPSLFPPSHETLTRWASSLTLGDGVKVDLKLRLNLV
ncbi:hypothetical protein VNO78_17234 [Psophocarpus tetragonolobus]|uniref:Uncharacterized protein n=1 Tax=Psophocarpus tetragonolobus TaxID=3891 RepID=A0AAN9SH57_PSOTE